jgi:hypothetical protein
VTFDKLTGSQLGEWRSQPVTQLFLEWLAWAADNASHECVMQLSRGNAEAAKATAGRSIAYEAVMAACSRQDEPVIDDDEDAADPVYRYRPDLAPKEEGTDDVGTE